MSEIGAVSVVCRADTPEEAAIGIATDIDEFLGERGLTHDDIRVLQASHTKDHDAFVHTLVMAYTTSQAPVVQNVPRQDPRQTRRLRPLLVMARELNHQDDPFDRMSVARFLGCSVKVLEFLVAPLYGVFLNMKLIAIANTWEDATAIANRQNAEES